MVMNPLLRGEVGAGRIHWFHVDQMQFFDLYSIKTLNKISQEFTVFCLNCLCHINYFVLDNRTGVETIFFHIRGSERFQDNSRSSWSVKGVSRQFSTYYPELPYSIQISDLESSSGIWTDIFQKGEKHRVFAQKLGDSGRSAGTPKIKKTENYIASWAEAKNARGLGAMLIFKKIGDENYSWVVFVGSQRQGWVH